MQVDYLIIGQGLAGSVFASIALSRGKRVAVVQDAERPMATRVAAGLINPITGMRLALSEQFADLVPVAKQFYSHLYRDHSASPYRETSILRLFSTYDEIQAYQKKIGLPDFQPYLGDRLQASNLPAQLRNQRGGAWIHQGVLVQPDEILGHLQAQIAQQATVINESFRHPDLGRTGPELQWKSISAATILFCEGHALASNPWFGTIPCTHAKGERLIVRMPDVDLDHPVVGLGLHVIPVGDQHYWIGGNYDRDDLDPTPTPAFRERELARVESLLGAPATLVDHAAGVRPITDRRTPVLGRHSEDPRLVVFNGLGSKGFLRAPYYAALLLDHLETHNPLPPEVTLPGHRQSR